MSKPNRPSTERGNRRGSLDPSGQGRLLAFTQWTTHGDQTLTPYGRGIPLVLEARLGALELSELTMRSVLFTQSGKSGGALMLDEMLTDETMAQLTSTLQPDFVFQGSIRKREESDRLEIEVSLCSPTEDPKQPTTVNLFSRQLECADDELLDNLGHLIEDLIEVLKLDVSNDDRRLARDFTTSNPRAFFSYLTALIADPSSEPRKRALQIALGLDPGYEDAAVTYAQQLLRDGDLEDSKKTLLGCTKLRARSHRALYLLGLVHENLNEPDLAKAAFVRFAKLRPGSALAAFHLGSLALAQGDNDIARDHLERCVEKEPNRALGWENLGIANWRLEDLESAAKCLQKSHELMPEEPRIIANLGKIHATEGRKEEAVEWFEKGLALDPADGSILRALALLISDQAPKKSIQLLTKATNSASGKKDPSLWMELAWVHARNLDFRKAEAALASAEVEAASESVRREVEQRLEELRNPDRRGELERRILKERFFGEEGATESELEQQARTAIDGLREFSEQHPTKPEAWFLLGLAHRRVEQLEEAAEAYSRCVTLNGRHVDALTELGIIEGQRGNLDESLRLAQEALEIDSDSPGLVCNVGAAHLRREELDEAEHYFQEAAGMDPEDQIIKNCLHALTMRRNGKDMRLK